MPQRAKEAKDASGAEPVSSGRADWARLAARLSVASAFACFTLNCVVNQLMLKNPQPRREWTWTLADVGSLAIIFIGIAAGVAGIYGGIRKKSGDTLGVALLGLFLHIGILLVAFWLSAALKSRGG